MLREFLEILGLTELLSDVAVKIISLIISSLVCGIIGLCIYHFIVKKYKIIDYGYFIFLILFSIIGFVITFTN